MTATDVDAFLAPPVTNSRVPVEPPARTDHGLPAGTEIPLTEPGSDAWYRTVSASKIAAIVGRSPWDSPYRLYRVMKGHVEPDGIDDVKAAGIYHEPGIASWFRDRHPDWTVRPCGTFVAAGNDRHCAAPDRLIAKPEHDCFDLLEIKTTRKPEQWGQPGTDAIPAGYRDQVMWQMHCAGASRCHVAVEFPWFEHAEYVIDYDPTHVAELIDAADTFLHRLDSDDCPAPDDHPKTLEAQQEVYGLVDDEAGVDVEEAMVRRYVTAIAARKAAEAEEIGATTAIVETLGGARNARHDGAVFAEWKPWREGSKPKLYAARTLPVFEDSAPPAPAVRPIGVAAQRVAWIKDRLKAIRDCSDPKGREAIAKFWPPAVAKPAHSDQWADADIDVLDALLCQVEVLDGIGFPPPDPTKPSPDEKLSEAMAARTAEIDAEIASNPTLRPIDDDSAKATKTQDTDLRASVAAMTAEQKTILKGWEAEGKRGGRPWRYTAKSTRRVAAVNAAAIACALVCADDVDPGDDTATRAAIGLAIGLDLQPAWSTGAVLGSLTIDEAQNVISLAMRFAAGDEEVCAVIGDRLTTHYAQLDAAAQ